MTGLTHLTMAAALDGLAKKEFTAVELTEAHVKAVETIRPLNAFITETPEQALAMAKASDARRAKGEAGPMEGLPIAVKDLFCTKGVLTTAASHILDGFKPEYESTVTSNLWRDGAVMLGKVNLDEFAMGSANITSHHGNVISPWSPGEVGNWSRQIVPGGSSGGSAAAVAARAALGATGTDTGGSIRQPAAFTGIVGIKPTYGRCSRWGVVAFASSLDQAGPMTRTVEDAAIMLRSMCGFDPKDSTSVDMAVPDFRAALTGDIRGLKVGIPKEYRVEGMPAEIAAIWDQGIEWLKQAGAEPVEISLPHSKYALATYYIVAPAEASSNLARYDGLRYGLRVEGASLKDMYENTRGAGFGKEVRRRILIGTYVLSAGYYDAYYNKARQVRTRIKWDFDEAFKTCDVILTPTAPSTAFAIGEKMDDPIQMYLNDVFTVPASLAGLPGMSVPAGVGSDGLPLGLQLLGRPFDEETVLRVGQVIEKAAAVTATPPFMA
ncbi:Asp-tRNA(Asn)/Glu-tRNA(Gln) amidotransferase subunit GatA [Azospirillum brasilense]|uniref:Glutamyl-tRNA(Gln) amidotransferase subunit A n=2 Tax=Azospirillum brasilense TaxID=192 RepID=A0A0N7I8K4_AZOBR|nr:MULTISPECIES: Asp-tRNA(Asn)/Glu-tRNA(Gln) amidotransferase subunit GatA [Azospirillum]ALJ37539.1 glutamyl-tRNA amidotransferase [Azospirillum brasilense]MDW7553737.1 Asp-tRNA(Asn)/Glu-tRNA(Gln) amidotransferase subunit GatA [Azospirillum brasilense]MDW7592824.1 Asp-tRNA(Asn)/Glu-tRNA(Gln) amidotransferase subunit GatA [Azospirillum brasilense]MDW7628355.1 Asp-tRNA(Asn)/Glu-tRNA(Gln) amidotransferase subunit GatA [Azospirillum brasilense]MDX5952294.1 Asp-tRNA(Asn)/Glu-tRNA(Gln) amidotransfer